MLTNSEVSVVGCFDRLRIPSVDGVAFQEVLNVFGRTQIVRGDQAQVGRVHHDLECGATDSPESINSDVDHGPSSTLAVRPRSLDPSSVLTARSGDSSASVLLACTTRRHVRPAFRGCVSPEGVSNGSSAGAAVLFAPPVSVDRASGQPSAPIPGSATTVDAGMVLPPGPDDAKALAIAHCFKVKASHSI